MTICALIIKKQQKLSIYLVCRFCGELSYISEKMCALFGRRTLLKNRLDGGLLSVHHDSRTQKTSIFETVRPLQTVLNVTEAASAWPTRQTSVFCQSRHTQPWHAPHIGTRVAYAIHPSLYSAGQSSVAYERSSTTTLAAGGAAAVSTGKTRLQNSTALSCRLIAFTNRFLCRAMVFFLRSLSCPDKPNLQKMSKLEARFIMLSSRFLFWLHHF